LLADVNNDSTLAATVNSISFQTTSVAAGSASAMSAGYGPGGLCWFLVNWKTRGTANWVPASVTSSSAHVLAHAEGDAVAGMAFEIPQGTKLSQYRSIQIVAAVTVKNPSWTFLIQGVNETRGLIWSFSPQNGTATYTIELSQPTSTFNGSLGLDEIKRFEIVSPVGGSSDLEVNVTAVNFIGS
jgi:hypothetical protein